jgi:predicted phage gp36 major capsid-like protein
MLFIKTQGVHWNVTGPTFMGVHKLTEEQYENMYEAIDELAERIRALGHKAPASYTKYGELSSINDKDEERSVGADAHHADRRPRNGRSQYACCNGMVRRQERLCDGRHADRAHVLARTGRLDAQVTGRREITENPVN